MASDAKKDRDICEIDLSSQLQQTSETDASTTEQNVEHPRPKSDRSTNKDPVRQALDMIEAGKVPEWRENCSDFDANYRDELDDSDDELDESEGDDFDETDPAAIEDVRLELAAIEDSELLSYSFLESSWWDIPELHDEFR